MIDLFRFQMLTHPWMLILLIGVLLVLLLEWLARAPGALTISTGRAVASHGVTLRTLLRGAPPLMRALGLAALIVALAGPVNGFQIRKDRVDVIDIMLCVDVSGSMNERDFVAAGQPRNRLFVTKAAVRDFIESRKVKQTDRHGLDRVGLILYAGYAWTQSPLSFDYGLLEHELEEAQVITEKHKDGTAIGSAIGLAVRRLSQSEAKSKVIILLTDGLNNRGDLDPITAAQVAKEFGIRVYTIGAGSPSGGVVPGGLFPQRRNPIDEDTLKRIAEISGARYFRATDTASLQEAYDEINALETTEIETNDIYEYRLAFMPYLVVGSLLILGAAVARRQWFEVAP